MDRRELVIFVEEPSAKAMLVGLLPRLLPTQIASRVFAFEGKADMRKRLRLRLRGYVNSQARFIVLRDGDGADCHQAKKELREICEAAHRPETIVRIACQELESWYLADLGAVEKALGIPGLSALAAREKYRSPDLLLKPSDELRKELVVRQISYLKGDHSELIGPHLDPENPRSPSFRVFVAAVKKCVAELESCG